MLALVATSLGVAIVTPGIAYTGMRMMDATIARSAAGATRWIVIECVLMVLVAVLTSLQQDAAKLMKGPLALEMTSTLALKVAEADPSDLEAAGERERLTQARITAETRASEFIDAMLQVSQGVVSLTICGAILARFSVWSLLLMLAAVPGGLAEVWCAQALYRLRMRSSADRRRFERLERDLLSRSHATENKFLDIGTQLFGRLRELGGRFCAEERALWRRSGIVIGLAQLLPLLAFYGFYGFLAIRAASGYLSFGAVTLCLVSFSNAQRFYQTALLSGRNARECWLHLESFFSFLDAPVRRHRPSGPPGASATGRSALRLENVGFRYAGSEEWALRNMSLDIEPGELIAIIGGNGSGKTTLLKLMTGLYRPTEGRILLDGRDLIEWRTSALRRRFAIVFQDFARYLLTLRENVSMCLQAPASDASLAGALSRSGVDEFVADLPRAADTELSRAFGDGVELSGGQWQKVAVARAFMREEAEYLLMDEPTSALDELSERRLLKHLAELRPHKSIVLITHRLAALRMADRILVLDRGRMIRIDPGEGASAVARSNDL